jgi:hypothetical protein
VTEAFFEIPGGRLVLLDAEGQALFRSAPWHLYRRVTSSGKVYEYLCNRRRGVLFHRVLTQAAAGMVVDHINGNGLDNRLSNLRVCSHAENMRNRKANEGKALPKGVSFKGVSFAAQIRAGEVRRFRRGFKTIEEAQACYATWAQELHGSFARI